MATPPRISMEKRHYDLELHNKRKEKILKEVGVNLLGAFELWAFKAKTPMIYDSRVVFIWQCAHATKETLPEDLDEAIDLIIQLWKARFGTDDSEEWFDVKVKVPEDHFYCLNHLKSNMNDERKTFQHLDSKQNPEFLEDGIRIYTELREKYPNDTYVDLDNILNGICASLICLIRKNVPKDNQKYIIQIVYTILNKNNPS